MRRRLTLINSLRVRLDPLAEAAHPTAAANKVKVATKDAQKSCKRRAKPEKGNRKQNEHTVNKVKVKPGSVKVGSLFKQSQIFFKTFF